MIYSRVKSQFYKKVFTFLGLLDKVKICLKCENRLYTVVLMLQHFTHYPRTSLFSITDRYWDCIQAHRLFALYQLESCHKRALQTICGDQMKGMFYFCTLSVANLKFLKEYWIKLSRSFFKKYVPVTAACVLSCRLNVTSKSFPNCVTPLNIQYHTLKQKHINPP